MTTDNYPVGSELSDALRQLFPDVSIPEGFLGNDSHGLFVEQNSDVCLDSVCIARVQQFRKLVESFVIQMAAELDELGPGEADRLRSEATGFLITLRELRAGFPEAYQEVS